MFNRNEFREHNQGGGGKWPLLQLDYFIENFSKRPRYLRHPNTCQTADFDIAQLPVNMGRIKWALVKWFISLYSFCQAAATRIQRTTTTARTMFALVIALACCARVAARKNVLADRKYAWQAPLLWCRQRKP